MEFMPLLVFLVVLLILTRTGQTKRTGNINPVQDALLSALKKRDVTVRQDADSVESEDAKVIIAVHNSFEVAKSITLSKEVKSCIIQIRTYSNRYTRQVQFLSKSLQLRFGVKRLNLDDVMFDGSGMTSIHHVMLLTEDSVRDMIKGSSLIPASLQVTTEVAVEKIINSKDVNKRFGIIHDFGIDRTGVKPVYFVDLQFSDGSIHRERGWSIKEALETSGFIKGDNVVLQKSFETTSDGRRMTQFVFTQA